MATVPGFQLIQLGLDSNARIPIYRNSFGRDEVEYPRSPFAKEMLIDCWRPSCDAALQM